MNALIDPTTQAELPIGYYVFTGLIPAFVGFISSHLVIHFYDHSRPRQGPEDEVGNRLAAKKVAIGMAVAFALFWVMAKRLGGGPLPGQARPRAQQQADGLLSGK